MVYYQLFLLKRHKEKEHMPSQNVPCDECDRICKTKEILMYHKRNVHLKKACSFCGKMISPKNLRNHIMRVHTAEHEKIRHKKCQICSKAFDNNQALKTHMNTHTGDKPYKCQYCVKAFADARNRKNHEKTVHEGFKRQKGGFIKEDKDIRVTYNIESHKFINLPTVTKI